jgi:hypothetical protein
MVKNNITPTFLGGVFCFDYIFIVMNLRENIIRVREMMGLITENIDDILDKLNQGEKLSQDEKNKMDSYTKHLQTGGNETNFKYVERNDDFGQSITTSSTPIYKDSDLNDKLKSSVKNEYPKEFLKLVTSDEMEQAFIDAYEEGFAYVRDGWDDNPSGKRNYEWNFNNDEEENDKPKINFTTSYQLNPSQKWSNNFYTHKDLNDIVKWTIFFLMNHKVWGDMMVSYKSNDDMSYVPDDDIPEDLQKDDGWWYVFKMLKQYYKKRIIEMTMKRN